MEGSCESEEDKARNKHPTNGTSLLYCWAQSKIADASLNIKGLIFFPSQSENTMIDLS